jgi:PAS domain S-box-containing protein
VSQKDVASNLLREIEELKAQLQEKDELLNAIMHGEVDALVVTTKEGEKVFTLKSAEEPYRIFIEQMNQGAIMLSDDDIILYCNNAFSRMVKGRAEKIIGKKIQRYISPMHLEAFNEMLLNNRTQKTKMDCTIQILAQDGSHLSTQITSNLLREENLITTCLVVTDLTAHMQEEIHNYTIKLEDEVQERTKRLADAQRLAAIGQTASMVGHDIRNPLQSIISELYLAKNELASLPDNEAKASMEESLASIEEQSFYINKIVADLQDFTKPLTPSLQLINLEDIIKESLSSIVIPENISAEIQVEKAFPKLNTDQLYMKRILVNLISNALQAMPQGGKLTVSANFRNNQVTINIQDTGFGIPEDVKPQIFKPLFTTKAKGQGLGLAVVKRLSEALNGSVTFDSEVGKGTAFKVTLPIDIKKASENDL